MSDKVLKVSVISPGNVNTIESFEAGFKYYDSVVSLKIKEVSVM